MLKVVSSVAKFFKHWSKTKTFWWNVSLFLVVVLFVSLRLLVITSQEAVHYHADFQVYINGQKELFDNFSYYEEISACSVDYRGNPASRVHMHDHVPAVIHVHDQAVTWGHFMSNLGFQLSNRVLETRQDVYIDGDGGRLRFILNGQPANYVANRIIESEDVLLIDFGSDGAAALAERYDNIPHQASAANMKQDPASCAGSGEAPSLWQSLREALGF